MKSLWDKLFGPQPGKDFADEPYPAELLRRIEKPKRGRHLSEEQKAAEQKRYAREMRERFTLQSQYNIRRTVKAGITHYRWSTCKDERTCEECQKLEGRTFAYASPPPGGHPGQRQDCPRGWCRCVAMAIVRF